jgi:hypothetical protein
MANRETITITTTTQVHIAANISEFLGAGRQPARRDASFDYCFNYFQSFRNNRNIDGIVVASQNVETSCLQLGFYLASWGMFRSSPLLEKSSKHYQPLLEKLVAFDRGIWDIDVPDYSDPKKVSLVVDCGKLPFPEKDLREIPGIDLRHPVRFIRYPRALATRRLSRSDSARRTNARRIGPVAVCQLCRRSCRRGCSSGWPGRPRCP